jgi:hypothetical protein
MSDACSESSYESDVVYPGSDSDDEHPNALCDERYKIEFADARQMNELPEHVQQWGDGVRKRLFEIIEIDTLQNNLRQVSWRPFPKGAPGQYGAPLGGYLVSMDQFEEMYGEEHQFDDFLLAIGMLATVENRSAARAAVGQLTNGVVSRAWVARAQLDAQKVLREMVAEQL